MINWKNNTKFSIDNVNFNVEHWETDRSTSTFDEFVIHKPRWVIQRYAELFKTVKPKNIFELGIWQGGSSVFFHKLAGADKIVTIDLSEERIAALDDYIEQNNLQSSFQPLYGIDQSNSDNLRSILNREFGNNELDFVIDDASHFLDETRNSFNALFPFVRPGGVYVIEDWSWAHDRLGKPDDEKFFYPDKEPLTKLIFEIVLACPSTNSMIEKIVVDHNSATIWRGSDAINPSGFDISKCCLARGRAIIAAD